MFFSESLRMPWKFIEIGEGFYGKPWSAEQRRVLFSWMNKMNLTIYMYAPKDDCKHRVFWRDLYSVEEAENLTSLIDYALEENVTFVYAISPGLDMSFSSAKDIAFLKRKLDQVATFGCKAFALLFDDIDPELGEADKSVFQSFAYAQVSVANELYEHLGLPKCLFCPTEYCAARAQPNVLSSEYLTTIGSKLLPGIEIMWTGPKVVSKKISIQSLEEVTKALKRPPIIWDNIHANDYDPRRLFLGPYDGRSPEIIPYIKGVLTNPNCEFETNFVACHTLSQWCKSNAGGVKKDIIAVERLSPVASDIKLEADSDFSSDDDIPTKFDLRYQPKQALKIAINEWLQEFSVLRLPPKTVPPPMLQTCNSVVKTCTTITATTNSFVGTSNNFDSNMAELDNASFIQPMMNPVNSLVDVAVPDSASAALDTEPMECVPESAANSPLGIPNNHSTESLMQVEMSDKGSDSSDCGVCLLTREDIHLLVDLFYLPFEHGSRGVEMLQDFSWLRSNAPCIHTSKTRKQDQMVVKWFETAKKFEESVDGVIQMMDRLFRIPNKALLNDLFPYIWDLKGVIQLSCAFVKWMGSARIPFHTMCHMRSPVTWYTSAYREAFMSGDQEPWVFRGGLQAEFQRVLPIEAAQDLFFMKPPEVVAEKKYNFRPYVGSDEPHVYQICLMTCDDGMDGTEVFPENPMLIGDRLVGGLATLSPEYCFVVEDEDGLCGYALASLDALTLHNKSEVSWTPAMREKYPKPVKDEMSPADEVILSFHNEQPLVPESIHKRYPSVLRLDVVPSRREDLAVSKRLLACVLSALKASGSIGVHCELNVGDKYMMDFYAKLGFFPIGGPDCISEEIVYCGRVI
ncbi:protein O-GlcNAcase-like isoform X1 [Gigantopelta aegis]|uniref:protein O-GlcNAcase-like isoform X1 n=1 Tax=Gigantopelta aegis TaxID=1735272 RepID=UPI001B88A15B|nr:protein O-GlcNAcase-like isoform X1 [Gigantopelta aegis]